MNNNINNHPINNHPINNDSNKETLWNLLFKNNVFNNIPNNEINTIKNIFEETITSTLNSNNQIIVELNNNINNSININKSMLLNVNKLLLYNLNNNINSYKNNANINANINTNINVTNKLREPEATKDKLVQQNLDDFNINLQSKIESFNSIINIKKPEEIDFTDKLSNDTPLDSEVMNNILEKMQKERNILNESLETNNANTNTKENENTNTNANTNTNTNANTNAIELEIITLTPEKQKIVNIDELLNIDEQINVDEQINQDKSNMKSEYEDKDENKDNLHKITDFKVELIKELTNKKKLTKNNSKLSLNEVKNFTNSDYYHENIVNMNIKIDKLMQKMDTLQTMMQSLIITKSSQN